MVSRALPRIDYIEQSIAISGFTDSGHLTGYIDLTDLIPEGSLVLGWKGDITTRFTGGTARRVSLSVGTPDDPEAFGQRRVVTMGASAALGDVPAAGQATDNIGNERRVRVTVYDDWDFGAVTGGALDISVYFVRTVA